MKTKILSILALLLTVTQGAWAQTTADVGRVIAADGKMYKTVTLANKVSTASGVVVYVGSTSGCVCPDYADDRVLVLAVNNTGYKVWGSDGCTHGGTYDSESAAITHLSGNMTTFMLYNEHISAESGHHTHQPAYDCRTLNVAKPSGAHEWFMPSAGQWNLMVKGLTGSNTNLSNTENSALAYDKLNAKIYTAAGAQALANGNYMLCTSRSTNEYWEYQSSGKLAHIGSKNTYGFNYRAMFTMTSGHSNGYVVEYNANGGSGAPAAQSKTQGTALTLSSTVPTRDGYTFAGWATSAEGAVAYSAGGSYTTDNDIVLYAQWTPTYNATFATGNDNTGWTIDPASGVEGATVTVSYSGENKVKSVTVQAK